MATWSMERKRLAGQNLLLVPLAGVLQKGSTPHLDGVPFQLLPA